MQRYSNNGECAKDEQLRARFHGLKFEPVNLVTFVNALTNRSQNPHPHGEPSFRAKVEGLFR